MLRNCFGAICFASSSFFFAASKSLTPSFSALAFHSFHVFCVTAFWARSITELMDITLLDLAAFVAKYDCNVTLALGLSDVLVVWATLDGLGAWEMFDVSAASGIFNNARNIKAYRGLEIPILAPVNI